MRDATSKMLCNPWDELGVGGGMLSRKREVRSMLMASAAGGTLYVDGERSFLDQVTSIGRGRGREGEGGGDRQREFIRDVPPPINWSPSPIN